MKPTIHPTQFSNIRCSRGTADRTARRPVISVYATPRARGRSSLRRDLIAAGIAIALAILAIASVVLVVLRNQTLDNSDRELAAVSRVTAERTSQSFSAADVLIRSIVDLATKPAPGETGTLRERAKTQSFHEALVRLQKMLPDIEVTAVVDTNGDVIGSSREYPTANLNVAKASFFIALKERPDRDLVISDPLQVPLTGQWMLYLARALTDGKGSFEGIVLAAIPIHYFEDYFSAIDLGASSTVTLVNNNARLIARWPLEDDLIGHEVPAMGGSPHPGSGEIARMLVNDRHGKLRRVIVTGLAANGNSFFLAVSRTQGASLQPWRSALVWIVMFAVTSLLVLVVLAWFILRAVRDEERWSGALLERETQLSKQAFELSAARDLAETANRARGDFLANMSHELRTPLNAILGFSEILEKGLFGPLGDPRYREFAMDIHNSGKHLLEVIGNILDLAKVDAGKLELYEQEFDIVEMMHTCGRLMTESANAGGVKFEVRAPRIEMPIQGDSTRVRQILLNLLSNAVKFTPPGGTVTLWGEAVEDGFILRVIDTGIGMTEAEAVEAMQPFHQIDSSLARRYQGTGLGLPLTKSLVTLHDGVLDIESTPGEGTTVTVWLPRQRTPSEDNIAA
jgi:signal transduction histidine kinase